MVKVAKIFTWLAHSPWLTSEHLIKRRKTLRRNTPSKILAYLAPSAAVLSLTAAILILSGVNPAGAIPGLTSPSAVDQFLDGAFPETSPNSSPDAEWVAVDYSAASFVEPIRIVEHPVENRLVVVGKDGIGWTISHEEGATDKEQFFDIRPIMHGKSGIGEGGISDIAFHPEFGQAGSPNASYVYITYRYSPVQSGTFTQNPTVDGYDRLSRFSVVNGEVDLDTEFVMMHQFDREQWHLGGDMFFGDDGFLYISRGDEGNCCNRTISTQRLDGGLWSGILRIDVDQDPTRSHPIRRQPTHPSEDPTDLGPQWDESYSQGYFIPNDNPFVDPSGANLEEFFSIGLRHPWTIALDPLTNQIWAADVGNNLGEEINLVDSGDNHQWGYLEGSLPGPIAKPNNVIGNEEPPVFFYPRAVGQAVIGAGVYRGEKFPELFGKYVFSDFISGVLWTAEPSGGGHEVEEIGQLSFGFPEGVNSYLMDSKDNILMAKTGGALAANGRIQQLVRSGGATPAPEPPQLLSQTGAFSDLQALEVHPGCVPYDLNVPFWSDGAEKSRWMCVPNNGSHNTAGEKIEFSAEGDWEFPTGAVLIKHFELGIDDGNPNARTRLETRFIVKTEDSHYGVTYRWNDAGTDAVLLTSEESRTVTIETANGGTRQQEWTFPDRNSCSSCHTANAGAVLGASTRQLNRDVTYEATGIESNQIETFNALGMFSPTLNAGQLSDVINNATTLTPTDDTTASLEDRARSYLDSNCSSCHRPGGVRANFDARSTTPLAAQNLINGSVNEDLGIDGVAVITPGNLGLSLAHVRANSAEPGIGMPAIGKNLVDSEGVSVLAAWINGLDPSASSSFEIGNDTSTGGPWIDTHHPSLYINEADSFEHEGPAQRTVSVDAFRFFAQQLGNPVTPMVVRVDGDNDFTVLAVGTTRTQAEYGVGENSFAFSADGPTVLQLSPGDEIAIGFMDAFPDGSGWGDGPVIPALANSGGDEIWGYLPQPLISQDNGFIPNRATPSIEVGESILDTNAAIDGSLGEFDLGRTYKFAVEFSDSTVSPGDPFGPIPEDAARGPELLVNGGFESVSVPDIGFVQVASVPGWQVTGAGGEFWADGFQGQTSSEGDVYAELDFDLDGVDGCLLYTSPSPRD